MSDAGHDHAHGPALGARALGIAIALNVAITAAEAAVGGWAGSLALLADAVHNLTDVGGLILAWVGARMALRAATPERTFGWLRTESLVAFVNGLLLLPLAGSLLWAGFHRLGTAAAPSGPIVMALGAVALAANAGSVLILRSHAEEDLGLRSALLHLVADAAASGSVILGGALMWAGVTWADPFLSIAIGLFTLKGAYGIVRDAAHVLAEAAPPGATAENVASSLQEEAGVIGVHHVHVWSISTRLRAMTAHVVVSEPSIAAAQPLLERLSARLLERFGIVHPTLQLEACPCDDGAVVADPRTLRGDP